MYLLCLGGFTADWQWVGTISPIFVFILLYWISGVRMLENSSEKRYGKREDYQRLVDRMSCRKHELTFDGLQVQGLDVKIHSLVPQDAALRLETDFAGCGPRSGERGECRVSIASGGPGGLGVAG
jgi:hypothetical protein